MKKPDLNLVVALLALVLGLFGCGYYFQWLLSGRP